MRSLLFLAVLLAGCSGPAPGPPPPAPSEAGVDARYERAFAALRVHPAVQRFAALHLDPSEPLAIEVSPEMVALDYAPLAPDLLGQRGGQALAAVEDSLAALTAADYAAPSSDDALPTLSMRQQRPLVLFFSRMNEERLAAQLYPNPYRRQRFEAVRDETPGLALLVLFEDDRVAQVYSGEIAP